MYDVPDMARLLNRREMLAATGVSGFVFDRMIKRGGMALTFGVVRAPVRDRYIASDPVFARTVIDFASASRLPQPQVGALVRLNNLVVLDAIVRAETEIEPLGLALIKGANAFQLMSGTRDRIAAPAVRTIAAAGEVKAPGTNRAGDHDQPSGGDCWCSSQC